MSVYAQPVVAGRSRLCFDERPCQLLDDMVAALPVQPVKVAEEDNEYVRKGTCVVLLTYDLDTGQRYTQVCKQCTKADDAEFMHEIIAPYYTDIGRIDLVRDNLNTHRYSSLYEHLPVAQARSLSRKVAVHFTPKHGL